MLSNQEIQSFLTGTTKDWIWTRKQTNGRLSFVFYREDFYELAEQMQLPDEIAFYNGLVGATLPTSCPYLKALLLCLQILVFHFARPIPELSIITNLMMEMIYGR